MLYKLRGDAVDLDTHVLPGGSCAAKALGRC